MPGGDVEVAGCAKTGAEIVNAPNATMPIKRCFMVVVLPIWKPRYHKTTLARNHTGANNALRMGAGFSRSAGLLPTQLAARKIGLGGCAPSQFAFLPSVPS